MTKKSIDVLQVPIPDCDEWTEVNAAAWEQEAEKANETAESLTGATKMV